MIATIAAILLGIHIAAGSAALLAALAALLTPKGARWHIITGRAYAAAMTIIFLTAVPLTALGADLFLLLIAVFSFYLVFAGWRFARNRHGRPQALDWTAMTIMALTGIGMWAYAAALRIGGDGQWITMLLFGAIAVAMSLADVRFYRGAGTARRAAAGGRRIRRHLTNMLAGTIATITAVFVVNIDLTPVWLPWILPTIVITPLIVWWNFRIARQSRPQPAPTPNPR